MDKHEKTIKLLESFLSDKEVDGVCGYTVISDDDEDSIQVIVILDIDYIQEANTKPGFVARMIREGVKQEIKKWLGLNVYVGSTAKKCDDKVVSESLSIRFRRRLSSDVLMDELNNIIDYDLNPLQFKDKMEYVSEVCDLLKDQTIDYIWETEKIKATPKQKDQIYHYFVNTFFNHIIERYNETHKKHKDKKINESVVYDYKEGRNESPDRLPFDVNKLIDVGAIFITPAIEGDPNSKHYKKFLRRPHTHLITLRNIEEASPDSWIHTAITRKASPKHWQSKDFSKNLYDGKYNQILWSLDKLGIPYESMLIDDVNEQKKKYVVTESQYNLILESQKLIQFFQDLIDNKVEYMRRSCEDAALDYEGDVGDESCRQLGEIKSYKVTDAEWVTIKHSNRETEDKYMSVKLMIYYSSIRQYGDFDADDFTYDLERMIRKSTGMPFILNYETTNTETFFEW